MSHNLIPYQSDLWITNGNPVSNNISNITSNQEFMELANNVLTSRSEFFSQFFDRRRNYNQECGYPEEPVDAKMYDLLYMRNPIAARVVEFMPKECSQVQPQVYEKERANISTPFEKKWDIISKRLGSSLSLYQDELGSGIWNYVTRADIASRIHRYGVMLLGINDGRQLSEPLAGFEDDKLTYNKLNALPKVTVVTNRVDPLTGRTTPILDSRTLRSQTEPITDPNTNNPIPSGKFQNGIERDLLYIRVLTESQARITKLDENDQSPRYCQPLEYEITLLDPTSFSSENTIGTSLTKAKKVHWSRVIHIADNCLTTEYMGDPAMHCVLNRLLDCDKVYASAGEMFWGGAFPGLAFESHPGIGADAKARLNMNSIRDQYENYMNSMQRYLAVFGMSVKSLAPQVEDPTPVLERLIEAICIKIEAPKRRFMGSEIGQLASEQDKGDWRDRVRSRNLNYKLPRLIIPLVDRLISAGVLPVPVGYSVYMPDISSQTDLEKAQVAKTFTDALSVYSGGNCEALLPPMEYYTRVWKLEDHEAKAIIDAAEDHAEELYQDDLAARKEEIDLGLVEDPTATQDKADAFAK